MIENMSCYCLVLASALPRSRRVCLDRLWLGLELSASTRNICLSLLSWMESRVLHDKRRRPRCGLTNSPVRLGDKLLCLLMLAVVGLDGSLA